MPEDFGSCELCYPRKENVLGTIMTAAESHQERPHRRNGLIIVVAVIVALLLYLISPYYSLWRFNAALRSHDTSALSSRVDFGAIRRSLKQQLRDHFFGPSTKKRKKNPLDKLVNALGTDPLDMIVNAYVTPEGLEALLANPARIKEADSLPSSALKVQEGDQKGIDWAKAGRAFFIGPRDFAVENEGIRLVFRFNGLGWRLHDIDLRLDQKKADPV